MSGGFRRHLRGENRVSGSAAAQPIGAVTLQDDVFTRRVRENEKRRSMTLRLTESKEEFGGGEIQF